MKYFIAVFLILSPFVFMSALGQQRQIRKALVTNTEGKPLALATVRMNNQNTTTTTTATGIFSFWESQKTLYLTISCIGYRTSSFQLKPPYPVLIKFQMPIQIDSLKEVVISTGYQQVPRERATGSFSSVSKNVINRKVSTDILSRLQDEVPGLIFNKTNQGAAGNNSISVRGQSTINSNTQPLIVIDNFAYAGDLNDLNPNDVESITVLKDAAAASIWGARAGNGVIVITTKKGLYNQPTQVSFSSNVTLGSKPDLFYQSRMSSEDFIGIERKLFGTGFYKAAEQSANHLPITPVVSLLIAARDGKISQSSADAQIATLAGNDVRRDFSAYFYQQSANQQYNLNLSGGSATQRYYLAGGYDKNVDNLVNNGYNRYTFNASGTELLFNKKLELTTNFYYTQSTTKVNNSGYGSISMYTGTPLYPYAFFTDNQGASLAIVKDYNPDFVQTAQQQGLLNWQYKPLDELNLANNKVNTSDYRLNTSLRYKILTGLNASIIYQYQRSLTGTRNLQSLDSYATRDLINRYTVVNSGVLSYNIPKGAILDRTDQDFSSQNLRGQLDLDKTIGSKNEISAIAGYEIQDQPTTSFFTRLYGYDPEHAVSGLVNYITPMPQYYYPGQSVPVPNKDAESDQTDRYVSWYGNAAYSYDRRYMVSGSIRFDESNLFGVNTNQKGVPLYSAGLGWNISNEPFYHTGWLPSLKLRLTYGYNGNVNKRLSAYTTANYSGSGGTSTGLPYALISNPPNPELRWERVQVINLGADFEAKDNRISGSLDYFQKKGIDLIGTTPFAPSTGITTFTGNTADTRGEGIDLALKTLNLNGRLKWQTDFIFSFSTDKVTHYSTKAAVGQYFNMFGGIPLEGKPLYGLYSYAWAGLDPQTGDPRGYLNGVVSKDYAGIIASATTDNIIFNGSARPTRFGSVRNTIAWNNLSLSATINYRLGYYFRQNSVNYTNVLNAQGGSGDYARRWQKPGDEQTTNVPSIPATANLNRDNFYLYSDALIFRGDNIRLQDIQFSYDLTKKQMPWLPVGHVKLYIYCNNIGILWKADKGNIDPDYTTSIYPPVRTYAAGIKVDF